MREQLAVFKREYGFYKQESEMLAVRLREETEDMSIRIRSQNDTQNDLKIKLSEAERENHEINEYNRRLQVELNSINRNMKQLIATNDQYQLQAQQFRDRELQYNELSREYRDKLEQLKVEREKLATKEEQFLKQIHKLETN